MNQSILEQLKMEEKSINSFDRIKNNKYKTNLRQFFSLY